MSLPKVLWLARHGESVANVARHKAEAEGLLMMEYPYREPDVPLSELGKLQSAAMGKWFAALPEEDKPNLIYTSTFVRTTESADILVKNAGLDIEIISDERLRERELGIFDRMTKLGATEKHPDECARREHLGKYYYRAPGGENWCDVILRVRSFWDEILEESAAANILILTHEVVVRCFRCVIESLTETEIMQIDRESDFHNGALLEYRLDETASKLKPVRDNFLPEM
ncbi:MAG TPA: histidine phosphatase family protein [Pyrinomonadaceae bacterium]|jgi:broad specificity phosphatase PhoE|nr:histidine phosphatase family protein [Pyrinomonadaceae bacterium]